MIKTIKMFGESITQIGDTEILDDCTGEYESLNSENIIQTNSEEDKISPNCKIVFKKEYSKCGHTKTENIAIPDELVNKTQEELKEKYKDWDLDSFSYDEITFYQKYDKQCGEHYVIKEKDGRVVVYNVLETGEEKTYQETEIFTDYLTDLDKINIKTGIKVEGKQNLNSLIEDFE